jgi:hypothetical protein
MEQIRGIQKLIRGQSSEASCALDCSIQDMLQNAEEKSYDKLVNRLKDKGMQYFDTPLVT